MSKALSSYDKVDEMVNLYKILANPSRILMLKMIAEKPRSIQEISDIMQNDYKSVAGHLNKMKVYGFLKINVVSKVSIFHIKDSKILEILKLTENVLSV